MWVKIWAQLLDKTVIIDGEPRLVYGLADFHCRPSRKGMGTHALRAFEDMAKQDHKYCIVGFCDTEEILQFYLKAGYHYQFVYQNKYLFTSIPVENIEVMEVW